MKISMSAFIEKAIPLRVLNVIVEKDGERVGHFDAEPDIRRNIYSASKSFTSAAVGFAVQEGLISLDERVTECFPEELPSEVSENLAAATVRDLLTMCLGQAEGNLMGGQRPLYEEKNWAKIALAEPFADAPGTNFVYNNAGPYLAGLLVQRRAGCDLVHYLQPRLFDPLGIRPTVWEVDPLGNTFGAGGLFLTCEELHRFGVFLLQEGTWKGKRLLFAEWIREAARAQVDNGSFGYGYLFWRGPENSFRADGKYCQWTIVLPDKKAVITLTAECREPEDLMCAVFEHLVPAL